jgi:hypothetical protein
LEEFVRVVGNSTELHINLPPPEALSSLKKLAIPAEVSGAMNSR